MCNTLLPITHSFEIFYHPDTFLEGYCEKSFKVVSVCDFHRLKATRPYLISTSDLITQHYFKMESLSFPAEAFCLLLFFFLSVQISFSLFANLIFLFSFRISAIVFHVSLLPVISIKFSDFISLPFPPRFLNCPEMYHTSTPWGVQHRFALIYAQFGWIFVHFVRK